MNWKQLLQFINHVRTVHSISYLKQTKGIISGVFKYNISILEYYQFRFFELNEIDKDQWAGSGYMYEYQRIMNPPDKREILDDKRIFLKKYKNFIVHNTADLNDLGNIEYAAEKLIANTSGKIVFKVSNGKCGSDVDIQPASLFKHDTIKPWMNEHGFDLAEEFIIQHSELNRLSPSAVNTVRIFTQINSQNLVEILGCRLRISVNSKVDNMAAGNLAAPIDDDSGIVVGPGVYSDITRDVQDVHPITGVPIKGFRVPFWTEILQMVKEAAMLHPQNRTIGWDVVVTEGGPGLIEGNHDWCKLLWQLPVKKGLKHMLEAHKEEKTTIKPIYEKTV